MASEKNYAEQAESDAYDTCDNFVDEMVEQWRSSGEVSTDLYNDYSDGDSYHHENHTDRSYSLTEAAELLDRLSDYEEDDEGLWQGLAPREAISAQAAYTYGNAVMSYWQGLVEKLNEHLTNMRDTLEGDEATEEQIEVAGERLIRLWSWIGDRSLSDFDGMLLAAWNGVLCGDRTAALVLADKVQEEDEWNAKRIREAVAAEAEEPEEEEADSEQTQE